MVALAPSNRAFTVAVAAAALASACSDDGGGDPLAGKARAFVTYNLGLAYGYVDYAEERLPALIDLVKGLDADVLCLQEVWTQADIDAVVAGVEEAFPYHHYAFLSDTTLGPAACTTEEAVPLRTCIDAECVGVAATEIAGCVQDHCATQLGQLSPGCLECAVANLGKEVEEIFAFCTTGSLKYTYEGANGLLMLSRAKLTNTSHTKIDPSTNVQRSVIGATVKLPDLGEVAVFCGHVAADLTSSGLPYDGPAGSWEGENRVQAEVVRDHAADHAGAADLIVVMGDYNSGPELPGKAVAELPEAAYKVFIDAGYTAHGPDACTFCADNRLNDETTPSVWIDHIFTKGLDATLTTSLTRIGTEPISITPESGGPVETNPSDHYGVRMEIGL